MTRAGLLHHLLRIHGTAGMQGWDFSVLDGRVESDNPPWDFEADCLQTLRTAKRVLDLGTGGGERILRLASQLPGGRRPNLTATEGWKPNVAVARRNLAPTGVGVYEYSAHAGDALPFDDDSYDLIMSRHESFNAREAARVLAPGGVLLSQQVDGRDAEELRDWFGGRPQYPDARLVVEREAFAEAGLAVEVAEEWAGPMEFADVEALVTYMALVPWNVPGFRIDEHTETLQELDRRGPLRVTQRRYRLYGRKP